MGLRAVKQRVFKMVRNMDGRATAWMIACGIALLAWITAPDFQPFGATVIAPETMVYFPGDPIGKAIPVAEGQAQLARTAKSAKPTTLRQLHFPRQAMAGAGFFLPSVPAETTMWVNGMVGGFSERSGYFGPGFGPTQMVLAIPASQLSFEYNRIDLLVAQGWDGGRRPLIFITPARTGPAFAVMMAQLETRLWRGAVAFGGLGLMLSLAGLVLLSSRPLFTGGALFSLALLDAALGVLPSWLRLTIAATGIAVMVTRNKSRHPALDGALIAATVAGAVAIALALGWAPSAPLLWSANVASWPLAGVAMPVLAVSEGRLVWADFIAARSKIREQSAIIAQQADALQDSIRAAAISEERQRFVRDMHDGVGGHLLSLLMRVRADDADSKDVAEELEKGLTDLRLMADSLDHVGHDLDLALAAFHRRAGQQLASAGLEFGWSKPQQLSAFQMDARAVLSLYRIIQETLSNCIRHAQASQFGVAFDLADGGRRLDIVIEDNGTGFVAGLAEEGRGLANIRQRAEALGGTVLFGPFADGKGCRIALSVPAG